MLKYSVNNQLFLSKKIRICAMSRFKSLKSDDNVVISPYFSPLKTRNQRKVITMPLKTLSNSDLKPVSGVGEILKEMPIEKLQKIKYEPNEKDSLVIATQDIIKKEANTSKICNFNSQQSTNDNKNLKKRKPIKIETLKEETCIENENKQQKWEPPHWKETLENLREIRRTKRAPVDEMGCEQCSDEIDDKTRRYHILISLMLSSQTKDQITFAAIQRLREHGLTPENIYTTDVDKLEKILIPVGFYKTKAKHVKMTSKILMDEYQSDIPKTIKDLIKLPGVGPKMAHICMKAAWNEVTGIGVDTHVHRIANRIKWVENPTKTPEGTRIALEKWLPFELWDEINLMLVGVGQTVCLPRLPLCDSCPNNKICPSREFKKSSP